MLEQLRFRLSAIQRPVDAEGTLTGVRTDHFVALLDGLAAGRTELIQMLKAGKIDTEVLRALEKELDADEIRARHLPTPLDRQTLGARWDGLVLVDELQRKGPTVDAKLGTNGQEGAHHS